MTKARLIIVVLFVLWVVPVAGGIAAMMNIEAAFETADNALLQTDEASTSLLRCAAELVKHSVYEHND